MEALAVILRSVAMVALVAAGKTRQRWPRAAHNHKIMGLPEALALVKMWAPAVAVRKM
jgi:hypothetical protein